jgi:hypothetical protein
VAQRWLRRGLGGLASALLFFMMALTFVDVVGRYLFNTPVYGGFEMTEVALATLIFAGLPLVTASVTGAMPSSPRCAACCCSSSATTSGARRATTCATAT